MRDQSPPSEQRKHQRTPVSCSVRLVLMTDGGEEVAEPSAPVSVRDVSLGGMFLECEQPLEFGVAITLHINEGARKAMALPAIVRWSKPGGFGVQFGLLGARDTHALLALVKKTAP